MLTFQFMFQETGKVTDLLVNYLGLTILKQWTAPSWKREQPSRLDGLHSSSDMKRPRSAIAWVMLLGQGCILGSSVDRNTERVKESLSSHAPSRFFRFFGRGGVGGGSEYYRSATKNNIILSYATSSINCKKVKPSFSLEQIVKFARSKQTDGGRRN